MKIHLIKKPGGIFIPANEMEQKKLEKLKNEGLYELDLKRTRNPAFHRKMFAFFQFAFQFWKGDNEFQDETKQFEVFRNHLTVLAGFYDTYVNLDGEVRVEAKSLSYGSMEPEEFEQCYEAVIRVALKKVFHGADSEVITYVTGFFD